MKYCKLCDQMKADFPKHRSMCRDCYNTQSRNKYVKKYHGNGQRDTTKKRYKIKADNTYMVGNSWHNFKQIIKSAQELRLYIWSSGKYQLYSNNKEEILTYTQKQLDHVTIRDIYLKRISDKFPH